MFGLDSPLSLFPPGMDPGKLYNPLMEMSDPRAMHPNPHGPYLKKKNKRKYCIICCNVNSNNRGVGLYMFVSNFNIFFYICMSEIEMRHEFI